MFLLLLFRISILSSQAVLLQTLYLLKSTVKLFQISFKWVSLKTACHLMGKITSKRFMSPYERSLKRSLFFAISLKWREIEALVMSQRSVEYNEFSSMAKHLVSEIKALLRDWKCVSGWGISGRTRCITFLWGLCEIKVDTGFAVFNFH